MIDLGLIILTMNTYTTVILTGVRIGQCVCGVCVCVCLSVSLSLSLSLSLSVSLSLFLCLFLSLYVWMDGCRHARTYIHTYIYISVCVCVCMCVILSIMNCSYFDLMVLWPPDADWYSANHCLFLIGLFSVIMCLMMVHPLCLMSCT